MARDTYKTKHGRPLIAWISIGVLLVAVLGLLATYVLRPARSPADNARTAEAVGSMDDAQRDANSRRDEKRNATSLL